MWRGGAGRSLQCSRGCGVSGPAVRSLTIGGRGSLLISGVGAGGAGSSGRRAARGRPLEAQSRAARSAERPAPRRYQLSPDGAGCGGEWGALGRAEDGRPRALQAVAGGTPACAACLPVFGILGENASVLGCVCRAPGTTAGRKAVFPSSPF